MTDIGKPIKKREMEPIVEPVPEREQDVPNQDPDPAPSIPEREKIGT